MKRNNEIDEIKEKILPILKAHKVSRAGIAQAPPSLIVLLRNNLV